MKKAALVAAALAMVLSLAACGNRDNNTSNDPATGNGTTQNGGSVNNGGTNGNNGVTDNNNGLTDNNGVTDNNNGVTGNNNGVTGNGTGTGTGTGTGNGTGTGTGSVTGSGTDTGTGAGTSTGTASGRSTVGSDLSRAADDVGDAVTGLVEDGRSAVARGASTTTFQRMLNNARVHDVDGVLTDGENSRW